MMETKEAAEIAPEFQEHVHVLEEEDANEFLDQDRCIHVLGLVEEACTDPGFLTEISDFAAKHASRFDDREDDHPIPWTISWNEYRELVEHRLERLMEKERISSAELASFCEYVADAEPHALVCVDYLLACVDYLGFVQLMLDHKKLLTSSATPIAPDINECEDFDEGLG